MKILLVQTSFLGDNILSTPVIAAIKSVHPTAELSVVTTNLAVPVYAENPQVAKVIPFDKRGSEKGISGLFRFARVLKAEKYDMVYSLHRSFRTALLLYLAAIPLRIGFKNASGAFLYTLRRDRPKGTHEVERNLAILGSELEGTDCTFKLQLPISISSDSIFHELCDQSVSKYALLVPGSVWPTKRWSATQYRNAAEQLLSRGKQVVIVGSPEERAIADSIAEGLAVHNLTGKTSIQQMFAIVRDAAVVICNDSMSLHVASSYAVPTVVVFCATSPAFGFGPWQNERARIVEKENLHCKPCRRHGSVVCPEGTNACMDGVPAAQVIAMVDEVAAW